jgi:hypothetical protein
VADDRAFGPAARDESRRTFVMCSALVKLALAVSGSTLALALSGCAGKQVLDLGGDAGGGEGGDVDASFVVGSTVPCDNGVCSPPDVCCESFGIGVACEAESLCKTVAFACTTATCPAGSVCCAFLDPSKNEGAGWTRCVQGSACPDGTHLVCALAPFGAPGQGVGCPSDEACYGALVPTCQPPLTDGGAD